MVNLLPSPKLRFFDANGDPLSGGKLYSYVAGSSTPLATYTDATGATPNANPVILDANGEASVFVGPLSYKFVLANSADVTQWTQDNIIAIGDESITGAKIEDRTITADKIALLSITGAEVADATITRAKLSATALNQVISSKTTTFTALITDDEYLCSTSGGAYTATLPTAVGNSGKEFVFKNTDGTNYVELDGNGTETIDGQLTQRIYGVSYLRIVSNNVGWDITGRSEPLVGFVRDVQANGTNGGTFTSGTFQQRVLNTEDDPSNFISLASNQFTLPAGRYLIEASAPGKDCGNHRLRMVNVTDGAATVGVGSTFGSGVAVEATLNTVVTITASKAFELQHRCGTTRATDGFGSPSGFGSESEIFAQVKITKLK